MKRIYYIVLFLSMACILCAPASTEAATMYDYCQVPSYVVQNVPPSIMIVVDNSGSMQRLAYYDGYLTPTDISDDNYCTSSASRCTGFLDPGAYPGYRYYGYFDPDYWYSYTSNRFVPQAPKTGSGLSGERAKAAGEWDGNFLNWLTMRRTDIMRKAMTGGKTTSGEGSGHDRLIGEEASGSNRGLYKQINPADNYTPYSGTCDFDFTTGSGTSQFDVSNCTTDGPFNVAVRTPSPVEGILQSIATRSRLGLTFYNTDEGGDVRVSMSGGSLSSTVNEINLTRPDTWTPLAETLWTVTGYFAQESSLDGGPGPRYHGGDYGLNNNVDPFNYSSGGQPRYPECAKAFVLYITDGEPCQDGSLPAANILDYAGKPPHDSLFNCVGNLCPAVAGVFPETYSFPATTIDGGGCAGSVAGFEDVALYMHTNDLRNGTIGADIPGFQNLTLYTVFAFGRGSSLLKFASINGGFEDNDADGLPSAQSEWDANGDGEPDTYYEATAGDELEQSIRDAFTNMLKRASSGTAASVLASGEGSGANLLQAVFYPRRRFGNDLIAWTSMLQNLWYYLDPLFSYTNIREDTVADLKLHLKDDYVTQIYFDTDSQSTKARRAEDTLGDGGSVLASVSPDIPFEGLSNLWEAGDLLWARDLTAKPRTIYTTTGQDSDFDGYPDLIPFIEANAALLRPYMNLIAVDEDLDGFLDGDLDRNGFVEDADARLLIRYVQGHDADAVGVSYAGPPYGLRNRTVNVGGISNSWKLGDILNSTPRISSWIPINPYHKYYNDSTYAPVGPFDPPFNAPADSTHFTTSGGDTVVTADGDTVYTTGYKSRGMAFSGANDGMLHAFKLGLLMPRWTGQTARFERAQLLNTDATTPLGHEMWAFIPKNALPYLRYMTDQFYCHIYTTDLSPKIVDVPINKPSTCVSTNYWDCDRVMAENTVTAAPGDMDMAGSSWRTVVIGGMRQGGACKGTATACTEDLNKDGSVDNLDCVNTPITVAETAGNVDVGFSSYFALDITEHNSPKLLWEFSNADLTAAELATGGLGMTTSGPAIIKIAPKLGDTNGDTVINGLDNPATAKNGRWFAVFGSGSTGPIDNSLFQFYGRSDQNLKLFILDLAGPGGSPWSLNTNYWVENTGIDHAFASSMYGAEFDDIIDPVDYQDDAVYVGYVQRTGAGTNPDPYFWNGGGVGRLFTLAELDPANWVWRKLINNVGPVTSAITHLRFLKGTNIAWIYFGSGRYYWATENSADDATGQRQVFGVKEPCYDAGTARVDLSLAACLDPALSFCGTPLTSALCGGLTNVTNVAVANAITDVDAQDPTYLGWYINLEAEGTYSYPEGDPLALVARDYWAERVITDPLASVSQKAVFFTTYKPHNALCAIGGKTFLWGLKYNTGGVPGLSGKAISQTSTGAIEQIDLKTAFSQDALMNPDSRGDRRSYAIEGVPPTSQGLSLLSGPPALRRIIHIQER